MKRATLALICIICIESINSTPTFVIKSEHDDFKIRSERAASDLPESYLWPNGTVPYRIEPEVAHLTCLIQSGMFHIMQSTCIYFRPKLPNDRYYLQVIKGDGRCWADPGIQIWSKLFPQTPIALGSKRCETFVAVVHELMHVLGFRHEHSRFDRDQYVKINYENIKPEKIQNFEIISKLPGRNYTEFDFDSIMLYSPDHFSFDNKSLTIESKISGKVVPNVWTKLGLSELDVKSVNMLYKCNSIPEDSNSCAKLDLLTKHTQQCESNSSFVNSTALADSLSKQCKQVVFNSSSKINIPSILWHPFVLIWAVLMHKIY